ncbi:MAG: tolB [Francisellaceae bacterium]|nr:tolB [Francisellaceae bacterium]
MYKKSLKILIALILIISPICHAAIYIEVTGGQTGGIPVAILPFTFSGEAQGAQNSLESINDIIQKDLKNSGQFKPLANNMLKDLPKKASDINFQYWQSQQAEYLVLGSIIKTGSNLYKVSFELFDVVKNKSHGLTSPIQIMHFDNITGNHFRALAHHISDLLFEKILGVKGIFSTRIAYVSVEDGPRHANYILEVADHDGYNPKSLQKSAYPLMSPSWSPDGKKIAFVSFDKNRASINIVDVASGKSERITQFPGINGAPSWSPDGRSLALVLSKDGSPKIYTIDLQTRQLRKITEGNTIDTEPRFTPDGQSIIFTSNRGGKAQVYKASVTNGRVERLTFKGVYNARPSLTPDGKKLIVMHRAEEGGSFSIAVQNILTGEMQILTNASLDESPSLAPNGMMVIYGSQDGVLGAVSLDGRVRLRLPARAGNVQEPAWSPYLVN